MENENKSNLPRLALFAVVVLAGGLLLTPGVFATLQSYIAALLGATISTSSAFNVQYTDPSGGSLGTIPVGSSVLINTTVENMANNPITSTPFVYVKSVSGIDCAANTMNTVALNGVNLSSTCAVVNASAVKYNAAPLALAASDGASGSGTDFSAEIIGLTIPPTWDNADSLTITAQYE